MRIAILFAVMSFFPAQRFLVGDIRIHRDMGKKPDFRKSRTPRFGFGEIDGVTTDSPPMHSRIDRDIVEGKGDLRLQSG